METKSRYEVISDLESQKRQLILEKDSLDEELKNKEKALEKVMRQKEDNTVILDRQIADAKDDVENFKTRMKELKVTKETLIKSVDESLKRFSEMQKSSK